MKNYISGPSTMPSRRTFIKGWGSMLLGSSLVLTACEAKKNDEATETEKSKSADPCTDFSGVDAIELEKRKKLGYVSKSPVAESNCSNCQLWLPRKDSKGCGSCQLFKGPVLTEAHCTYWAPQIGSGER